MGSVTWRVYVLLCTCLVCTNEDFGEVVFGWSVMELAQRYHKRPRCVRRASGAVVARAADCYRDRVCAAGSVRRVAILWVGSAQSLGPSTRTWSTSPLTSPGQRPAFCPSTEASSAAPATHPSHRPTPATPPTTAGRRPGRVTPSSTSCASSSMRWRRKTRRAARRGGGT